MSIACCQHCLLRHIHSVHIQPNRIRIHTRCVFSRCIAEFCTKIHCATGNHRVFQKLFIIYLNGVYRRIVHVIHICAINKLQIIKVNRTSRPSAHFCSIDKHQSQGISLANPERSLIVSQVCLQILPSSPGNTGLCPVPITAFVYNCFRFQCKIIAKDIIHPCCFYIPAQPKTGLRSGTIIRNACSLRCINPNADSRRYAIHI